MTERIKKILYGMNIKPKTSAEKAVKYAVDHAGSGGGGSDLPEITGSDNGKLLGVELNEWSLVYPKKELSRISFVVTIDESTGSMTGTAQNDFSVILNRVKNGDKVISDVTIPGGIVFEAPLTAKNLAAGNETLVFGVVNKLDDSHKTTFYQIGWDYEGTVQVVAEELT